MDCSVALGATVGLGFGFRDSEIGLIKDDTRNRNLAWAPLFVGRLESRLLLGPIHKRIIVSFKLQSVLPDSEQSDVGV